MLTLLLPPNVRDFVPKDHVSWFVVELVRESLDLKAIMCSYVSGLGQPPFDRRMMVSLLLHGYANGLYSSWRIARACCERNDFVMIVALDAPDFRTISDFRKRHLKALGELFLQVLKLCAECAPIECLPCSWHTLQEVRRTLVKFPMCLTVRWHHVFRVGAFGEAREAAQIAEERGYLPAMAFELLLGPRRDDQIGYLRREKTSQLLMRSYVVVFERSGDDLAGRGGRRGGALFAVMRRIGVPFDTSNGSRVWLESSGILAAGPDGGGLATAWARVYQALKTARSPTLAVTSLTSIA